MSHAAEKARYFLELCAPQLQSFAHLGIFTADEIRSLVATRSEHEHRVLSPNPTPDMWLAYISWDQNVEALRSARCAKLHIRNSSKWVGEARILKTFERATSRHPGSLELWRAYLEYVGHTPHANDNKGGEVAELKADSKKKKDKKKESHGGWKKWNTVWTKAVRLHSRNADLWIIGAKKMILAGNMAEARTRFMYGCRNCVGEDAASVWVAYGQAEMKWLAHTERKLAVGQYSAADEMEIAEDYMRLGPKTQTAEADRQDEEDEEDEKEEEEEDENGVLKVDDSNDEDGVDGLIKMGGKVKPLSHSQRAALDEAAAKQLEGSSVMEGAIPKSIFDLASKQEFFNPAVAVQFWDAYSTVNRTCKRVEILKYMLHSIEQMYPDSAATDYCRLRLPLVIAEGAAWGLALKAMFTRLGPLFGESKEPGALARFVCRWFDSIIPCQEYAPFRPVLEAARDRITQSVAGSS